MKTSDLQFDRIMTATKSAKAINAETTKKIIESEKVQIINREFNINAECTIRESFQKLSMHGYEYENTELEKVINNLNNIK